MSGFELKWSSLSLTWKERVRGALSMSSWCLQFITMGERQSIAQKGVHAIDARNSQPENGSNAAKTSVRAPGPSTDEREHSFV